MPELSTMDAIRFVVAVLMVAGGALSLCLFVTRIRRRELSLLYFGLGAGLYGIRLLMQALHSANGPVSLLITLLVPVPLILFLVATVAPDWARVGWWIVSANIGVAAFGVVALLLNAGTGLVNSANSVVILLSIPVFIALTFFQRRIDRDLRILQAGVTVFLLFVIYTNLAGLRLLPFSNIEFIGFAINLCCLGYVALSRTQRKEERLISLHKELEIARNIQAQLLPQATRAHGPLTIASRYVPATTVAGDFYDFITGDEGLGVLVADVSGHGIPAALSASMVKVAIRSQAAQATDPAEVLRGMNAILCGNLQGQFVSAAYLFMDPARRKLIYAGAGHPPLLIWRLQSRKVETLVENGLPLGIFADGSYTAKTAPLDRGDRCLLYTDGILEAPCPAGEEFGPERLGAFLAEHSDLPAQAFCDWLVQRVNEWCGPSHPHDDLTVVVVDYPA